jgi:hypothetical protein
MAALTLTPSLEEQARSELNETKENRETGLKYLKHLVATETSYRLPNNDDEFLIKFLRFSKWDHMKAFDRLKRFYEYQIATVAEHEEHKPTKISRLFKEDIFYFLPKKDGRNGRKILYMSYPNWNPEKISGSDVVHLFLTATESILDDPEAQINGITIVGNALSLNAQHLYTLSPTLVSEAAKYIFTVLPLNMSVHMVNAPPLFQWIDFLGKQFAPENRYFVHKDLNSLYQHVDKDVLPAELGGKLGQPNSVEFEKDLLNWEKNYWDKQRVLYNNPN